MPLPPQIKSNEADNCVFCGRLTHFRSVKGRPCCKECYYGVSDNLDTPITDGSDDDDDSGIKLRWIVAAIFVIVLLALGIAKACSGPTMGNYQ